MRRRARTQSPGLPKAFRPSTALRPLTGPKAFGEMSSPSRCPEPSSRAFDNRPVSCRAAKRCLTPFQGDEICLVPINPALPWTTFQLEHVGGTDSASSMGLSQSSTLSKTHWKCGVLHIDVIPSTIGENASSLPCAALSLISSRRSGMPPTHALRVLYTLRGSV